MSQLLIGDPVQGQNEKRFPQSLNVSGSCEEGLKDQRVMREEAPGDVHSPQF